jgi:hypothetical protein
MARRPRTALRSSILIAAHFALTGCAWWTPPEPVISYGLELSYQGRFADHPVYRRFLASFPQLRASAIRRINQVLGLDYRDNYEILIRFADSGQPGDPAQCRRFWRSGVARTELLSKGGFRLQTIVFCLDPFVRGRIDLPRILIHELTHAVVFKVLGLYEERLPPWFREGLATLLSWEGPERVRNAVAGAAERGPLGILAGLDRIESAAVAQGPSYFEYYLHTRFLEERGGRDALARLFSHLLGGQSLWEAVARVTGLERPAFWRASDEAARRTLEDLAEANGLPQLRRASAALRESPAAGITALGDFLARQPGSLYRPLARYRLAGALLEVGRYREALALLTKLAGKPVVEVLGLGPAVRLHLARALAAAGDSERARTLLTEMLRDDETPDRARGAARRLLEKLPGATPPSPSKP